VIYIKGCNKTITVNKQVRACNNESSFVSRY
jgi:hypothetical protein